MKNDLMILDGEWDFAFTAERPVESMLSGVEFSGKMAVPGCFDAQGAYRFRRGCGVYRKKVGCQGRVMLEIDGIGLRGTVFWDGAKIGELVKPFTAETFVFDAGGSGEHEIIIATENILDTSPSSLFHPFYDFYGYGGIYRSVTLRELPDVYIEYAVITPVSLAEGTASLHLEMNGCIDKVRVQFDGEAPLELACSGCTLDAELAVPHFKEWTPETPGLHILKITAGDDEKTVRFGMRIVKVENGEVTLNGKAVKLIGFNRHDSHPDFGYAMPEELVRRDLELIKSRGYNFIRGSHYAQSETVLDICDELGLLVWDESLGWGNKQESLTDGTFCSLQIEQTRQMVRRSINHPSVIMWGFLNEAKTDIPEARAIVKSLVDTIKAEDTSRPVTFATMYGSNDVCLDLPDIISFNTYPGWYGQVDAQDFPEEDVLATLRALTEFTRQEKYRDKAVILSEIGAAALPGDHSGLRWSEEYQSRMAKTVLEEVCRDDRWSGVAFWLFADTKTYSDGRALMRPRGFNNKGLVNEYRQPKLAWHELAELLKTLKNSKMA